MKKNIRFIGRVLPPNKTSCGSIDGDIGVDEFNKAVKSWDYKGCGLCSDTESERYAFTSMIEGAEGDIGICGKCLDRLNTLELVPHNMRSNAAPPTIYEVVGKVGWVTEADVVVGFEKLSKFSQDYRRSQEVWLDPKFNRKRAVFKVAGVHYIVDIGGIEFKFYCLEDVWGFRHVKVRSNCSYHEFIITVVSVEVWKSEAVTVRLIRG